MNIALVGIWVWTAVEVVLRVRDRLRHRGSTARDGGTRPLIVVLVVIAVAGAELSDVFLPSSSVLLLLGAHAAWMAAGVAIMVVGLVVRLWAITVLGAAFRTTVEVDEDQVVVDNGPYRWVRHPSYTGALLIIVGFGIAEANLISVLLAVVLAVVLPVLAFALRIRVEERARVETMGAPYENYRARTKGLVPGVW
ncbi:hypothetical protein GCM10023318_21020 [Nocardia callitridis]|uniref:Isoprenylcysteine carboxylmethyltransferase family protein n=1 Tax=Nocardia callitridis TaxID=648753 RepID=A0ABP9K490_9NOCA